jgi:putative flavoprotein involved in K+ transport
MKFEGDPDGYPTKNEVIQYLRQYVKKFKLEVRSDSKVKRVALSPDGVYTITIEKGDEYQSRTLIAASGPFLKPYIPELDGMSRFNGAVVHSYHYSNPAPYKGQRVLVVGAGNSAVQIAADAAQVGKVTLATRTPVKFTAQRSWGKDLHFWLRVTGLDTLPLGHWNKVPKPTSVIDAGGYELALHNGVFDQRQMFVSFTETGVVWENGTKEDVDAVIFATGYSPSYPYLTDLGALHEDGEPIHRAGVSLSTPGLYYVGLPGQRAIASATLRGSGNDAKYVIRKLRRYLNNTGEKGAIHHEFATSTPD